MEVDMRIIRANISDVPRIMECAREFTSIIPDCPLDEDHYRKNWESFLSTDVGVIYLLEDDGHVAGGIGGIKHPDLLTGILTAVELFWYVKPNYRGSRWAIRLFREWEVWAALSGCGFISMIHEECSMPGELKRFYERAGYQLLETVYRKKIGGTK